LATSELNTARTSRAISSGRTVHPSSSKWPITSENRKLLIVNLHHRYGVRTAGRSGMRSLVASYTPSLSARCRKHQETRVDPLDCVPAQRSSVRFTRAILIRS
jgi:hypothetical protein